MRCCSLRGRTTMLVLALGGCGPQLPGATLDDIRQPTGLAMSPGGGHLFVTNGNWDQEQRGSAILVLDLAALDTALTASDGTAERTPICEHDDELGTLVCDASRMVVPGSGVRLGSGAGNLVVDLPSGGSELARVLTVQRIDPAIVWFEVIEDGDGPRLDCGAEPDGGCDAVHTITAALDRPDLLLPSNPSRIALDTQGYRYAYVPQLLGGALSLVALDGEFGPELVDVVSDFYRADPFAGTDFAGGFGVASRPCDLEDPPEGSRECTRPFLYGSQRFFPSVRRFSVALGLDAILPGDESVVPAINPEVVDSVPFMGDLAFEDPTRDDRLLVVQTSPGGLVRVDTSVSDSGDPFDDIVGVVPLCEQPNMLAVHRPEHGEALALVTCFGEGQLAVVGLDAFRMLTQIQLGDGANEIAIDPSRQRAFVANTRDDSISVVGLDRSSAGYLRELARIRG